MDALIVGAGTMGRWFADVTDEWLSVRFTDVDLATAEAAAAAYDASHVHPRETEPIDLVCTAVPLSETAEAIARYAPLAERAVIDLSGIMRDPVHAMREHAPGRERLSLHPLFAPENAPGNIAVVAEATGEVFDRLDACLRAAGNAPFETTISEHDRAMETVQSKAHASLVAYALAADVVADEFQTPISRCLTELARSVLDGNPRVYAEIQTHFPGADTVANEAQRVATADEGRFVRLYREASARFGADHPTTE